MSVSFSTRCLSYFIAVKQSLVTQTFSDITDDPIEQISYYNKDWVKRMWYSRPTTETKWTIVHLHMQTQNLQAQITFNSIVSRKEKKYWLNQNLQDQGKQSLTKQHCSVGLPNMNHWTISRIPLLIVEEVDCWSIYWRKRHRDQRSSLIRCVMPFVAPPAR